MEQNESISSIMIDPRGKGEISLLTKNGFYYGLGDINFFELSADQLTIRVKKIHPFARFFGLQYAPAFSDPKNPELTAKRDSRLIDFLESSSRVVPFESQKEGVLVFVVKENMAHPKEIFHSTACSQHILFKDQQISHPLCGLPCRTRTPAQRRMDHRRAFLLSPNVPPFVKHPLRSLLKRLPFVRGCLL